MRRLFYLLLVTAIVIFGNTLSGICQVKHILLQKDYDNCGSFHEGLAIVEFKGKYGYIDRNGNEVIPCQYDEVTNFKNGIAKVKSNYLYGFIDKTGEIVAPCKYAEITKRLDGSFNVKTSTFKRDGEKYGLLDKYGKELIPCKKYFDHIGEFRCGLASVVIAENRHKKYGYIDISGNEIIPCQYNTASWFSEGLAIVDFVEINPNAPQMYVGNMRVEGPRVSSPSQTIRTYAVIDVHGNIVFRSEAPIYSFHEGVAIAGVVGHYYIIDKNGTILTPREYDVIRRSEPELNNLFFVRDNLKNGVIDKNGKEIIPIKYEAISNFHEGLVAAKLNGKWGYINEHNEVVIPFTYDYAKDFVEGLAVVKLDGKWGCIDKAGKIIAPFRYDKIEPLSHGFVRVNLNDKWGYINKNGMEIECKYNLACDFSDGLARVKLQDKGYGYIDTLGKEVIPCKYSYGLDFNEGLAAVFYGDKLGYINKRGEVVLHTWVIFDYDEMRDFVHGLAVVRKGNKWGMVDETNKEILPCQYDEEIKFVDNMAIVCMNGKWGCVYKNGKILIDCIYDNRFSFNNDGIASVSRDGKYGAINKRCEEILPCLYDEAVEFVDDLAIVCMNGKWGCFGLNGKIIARCIYDKKFIFNNHGVAIVCQNGKYGMINKEKIIVPCQYDQIGEYNNQLIQVKKDGFYGYIYRNGVIDFAQCYISKYNKRFLSIHSAFNIASEGYTRFYLAICNNIPNNPQTDLRPICILQLNNMLDTRICALDVIEVLDVDEFKKLKKDIESVKFFLIRISDKQYAKMEAEKQQVNAREELELNKKIVNTMGIYRGLGGNQQRATGWQF